MLEITLSEMIGIFESDWASKISFVGVSVKLPNGNVEYIINSSDNFKSKIEYYKNAYNEDLTLKANSEIQIVGFAFGDNFQEIQDDLFI